VALVAAAGFARCGSRMLFIRVADRRKLRRTAPIFCG
jgi:hypothetical protein